MSDRRTPQQMHAEAVETSRIMRLALMGMSEPVLQPMREWLAGQEAYFLSNGYSPDEARAMAAVTYVTVFGFGITRTPPELPKE